jgi:Tol biopolymer transport system component
MLGTNSGTGYFTAPTIGPDGRFVAFDSTAFDLLDKDTNGDFDIFIFEIPEVMPLAVRFDYPDVNAGDTGSVASYFPT